MTETASTTANTTPDTRPGPNLDPDEYANKILLSSLPKRQPAENSNLALELDQALKRQANRTLLIDYASGRRWTGEDIYSTATKISTGLLKLCHLKSGQMVLLLCDHNQWETLIFIGSVLAGCSVYSLVPEDGIEEAIASCELVQPGAIAISRRYHKMVLELQDRLPKLANLPIIWVDPAEGDGDQENSTQDNSIVKLDDHLLALRPDLELLHRIASHEIKAGEFPVFSLLTSGSTGRPKLVELIHEKMVHSIYAGLSGTDSKVQINDQLDSLFGFDSNSVLAGDLPLDHGVAVHVLCIGLILGSPIVIIPAYNVDSFWQAVHDLKITASLASATFTYKLLMRLKREIGTPSGSPDKRNWELSSLKYVACSGSRLDYADLINEINVTYPKMNFTQAYGCTEVGFVSCLPVGECRSHLHSIGYLLPGIRAKVTDLSSGERLGPGQRGELCLSAPSQFTRYKCHPEVDGNQVFRDCHDSEGYYRTGDVVHYDCEGRIYIHGRIKETLFLMQDWKVMPAELEQVVNEHPLVEFSTVIGIPDPDLPGCDAPKAFVKLISKDSNEFKELEASGMQTSLIEKLLNKDIEFLKEDIYKFAAEKTAEPKHLRGGVRILEHFPTAGSLKKIDRKALKLLD